jgi:hypothetical protein
MIRRREFTTLLGGAAAWPLAARAQQPARKRRIGVLMALAESDPEAKPRVKAFEQGLQDWRWVKEQNLLIDYRWIGTDITQAQSHAAELARISHPIFAQESRFARRFVGRSTGTLGRGIEGCESGWDFSGLRGAANRDLGGPGVMPRLSRVAAARVMQGSRVRLPQQ